MEDYKYTCQYATVGAEKYEQYPDLKELYNKAKQKDNNGLIPIGINGIKLSPGITVVAGITGHGKSMLGNSIAYRAVQSGLNVVYITLEVSKENMLYQMISIKSFLDEGESKAVSHSTIKKRELTSKQEDFVFDKVWPDFKNLKGELFILSEWEFDTTNSGSLQSKLMEIEEYSKNKTGRGIDFMIVDYIQLFKQYSGLNLSSEYSVLTNWVNDFRKMSLNYLGKEREIPIVLISQLNRDALNDVKTYFSRKAKKEAYVPGTPGGVPKDPKEVVLGLSQIAGCVEIAKAANQIITIYSDESYKASNQCLIQVLKNRDGATKEEPFVSYMNPVYYWVGKEIEECNSECSLSFEEIFSSDFLGNSSAVDLNTLLSQNQNQLPIKTENCSI